MSLLRRRTFDLLRAVKTRGGSWDAPYPGGYWGPGCRPNKGWFCGMTPPAPGDRRIWESWEAPLYFTVAVTLGFLVYNHTLDPYISTRQWARIHAKERELEAGIDGTTFYPDHLRPWLEGISAAERERLDRIAAQYGPLKAFNEEDRRHNIW